MSRLLLLCVLLVLVASSVLSADLQWISARGEGNKGRESDRVGYLYDDAGLGSSLSRLAVIDVI